MTDTLKSPTRRQLLSMIGKTAGATAMYQAMTTLGFASESSFKAGMDLKGAPPGASIIILGAGLAGLTAAYELRKAGYSVKVGVAGRSMQVRAIQSLAAKWLLVILKKAII